MDQFLFPEISVTERKELIRVYRALVKRTKNDYDRLSGELKEAEDQLKDLQEKLDKLIEMDKSPKGKMKRTTTPGKYTYQKIENLLRQEKKCLTTKLIVNKLFPLRPDQYNTVSSVISQRVNSSEIFFRRTFVKNGDSYVGLIEWLEDKGDLESLPDRYIP